jgi:RNA polymerase sigma-70 factor (ECF subfamily)
MSTDPVITRRQPRPTPPLDEAVDEFMAIRPRLLTVACRVLGDRSDAEDVVQEAWLRWQTCDRSAVLNSAAFLITTTTRLAINATQSARSRHELPVDRWTTEPAVADDDPTLGAEQREAVEPGLRMLLERLSPAERAAYILRHAFGYPYTQVADLLHLTEVNARQLVSRAQRHLARDHTRSVTHGEADRLMRGFSVAAQFGDLAPLEALLASGVSVCSGRAPRSGPRRGELGRPVSHSTTPVGHRSATGAVPARDREQRLTAAGIGGRS